VSSAPPGRIGDAPFELAALLDRYPALAPPVPTAGAAVTIVLRQGLREVEVLLIVRATNPADPASGQVGLPGGHVSEGDETLLATALRELEEEVGLTGADLDGPPRYVGVRPARAFNLHVGVFAGALGPRGRAPVSEDTKEVAHVFWLPRTALGTTRQITRDTVRGAIKVNATLVEGQVLWGFTRRVLRDFFGFPPEDELGGPALPGTPS
jgi:8-oxo-dGTP pyrophosphatase MutT (NUDIX family)